MRYPRFTALLVSILVGIIFYLWERESFIAHSFLQAYPYTTSFVAGIFMVYGLTAAPATAVLLFVGGEWNNLFLHWMLATIGATLGDYLIFRFIRFSLAKELNQIRSWRMWLHIPRWHERLPQRFRNLVRLASAGFLIASPLPDELGISLLATTQRVSTSNFLLVATLLDALGIATILWLGHSLA